MASTDHSAIQAVTMLNIECKHSWSIMRCAGNNSHYSVFAHLPSGDCVMASNLDAATAANEAIEAYHAKLAEASNVEAA